MKILKADNENEVKQLLMTGWKTFNKNRDKMKNILPVCLTTSYVVWVRNIEFNIDTWKTQKWMNGKSNGRDKNSKRSTWFIREEAEIRNIKKWLNDKNGTESKKMTDRIICCLISAQWVENVVGN